MPPLWRSICTPVQLARLPLGGLPQIFARLLHGQAPVRRDPVAVAKLPQDLQLRGGEGGVVAGQHPAVAGQPERRVAVTDEGLLMIDVVRREDRVRRVGVSGRPQRERAAGELLFIRRHAVSSLGFAARGPQASRLTTKGPKACFSAITSIRLTLTCGGCVAIQ